MEPMEPTTHQFTAQPPPHDLPAPTRDYAGWSLVGIGIYGGFLGIAVIGALLWRELRALRAAAEALSARLLETRDAVRREVAR